jgi:hypothetical protein
MFEPIDALLVSANAYSAATGITLREIGYRAIKQGRVFERIAKGQGITLRSWRDLMSWLAAQDWPVLPPQPLWPWIEAHEQRGRQTATAHAEACVAAIN